MIVHPVVEPMEHFTALVTVQSSLLTVTLVLVQIVAGLCSLIKVEGVRDPLLEAPDRVAEPLLLFCQAPDMMFTHLRTGVHNTMFQGQGLMPSLTRRASRQSSTCSQGSEGQAR